MIPRFKEALANACLVVSVCAFVVFIHCWSIRDDARLQWAFAIALIGWLLFMFLRRDEDHE